MNHIYSKVWNHTLGAFVVASELASRQTRTGSRTAARALVMSALAAAILPAMAQTVTVDERQTTGDFERGVYIEAWDDTTPVAVVAGRIDTAGRWADGILVRTGGDIRIDSDQVSISGAGAQGVVGLSYDGDIEIHSGSVDSRFADPLPEDVDQHSALTAVYGGGVFASSALGNVSVHSGVVSTRGTSAYGVGAQTGWGVAGAAGNAFLSSDQVQTTGDYAIGLYGQTSGTGTVTVYNGQVRTAGLNSHAIYAVSVGGAVEVDSASVVTTGDNAHGILARGGQGVTVRSVDVLTEGGVHVYGEDSIGYTYGISAEGGAGSVLVDSRRVETRGEHSIGIRVRGGSSATIDSDEVVTSGDFADGISVEGIAEEGPISIRSGSVTTAGRFADGIRVAQGGGAIDIDSGTVQVAGAGANGIVALSGRGDIRIESGEVTSSYSGPLPADNAEHGDLSGVGSVGLWASTVYGNAEVVSGSVTTHGDGGYGIGAESGWGVADSTGTVSVTSEWVETHGASAIGIYANAPGTGLVTVSSSGLDTYGDRSHGIWATAGAGGIQVEGGVTSTDGYRAFGISAQADGAVQVDSTEVLTAGDLSMGILGFSGASTVDIDSGYVGTTGVEAYGIAAYGHTGTRVVADEVQTWGQGAIGIDAVAPGGQVSIQAGRVTTAGASAHGIVVADAQSATVDSDEVVTEGDFADGISVDGIHDGGSILVRSGSVTTSGRFADGIRVTSGSADISIESGSVSISGAGAQGILALSDRGDIRIESTTVDSAYAGEYPADADEHSDLSGVAGVGLWASTNYGSVEVVSGSVVTRGEGAYGIGAETGWGATNPTGSVSVTSDSVSTWGDVSYGIYANTGGTGAIAVDSGSVQTRGDYSIAVFGRSYGTGAVSLLSDSVATAGYNSHGVYAVGAGGRVTVESGTVATSGVFAYGILARGNGVVVKSGSVTTTGESVLDGDIVRASYGILAEGGAGTVSIDSGSVATSGSHAGAIVVRSGTGATIDSDQVVTAGDFADGISVEGISDGGLITIRSGSVTTAGRYADGIRVGSGTADVDITSGAVTVSGAGAQGILVLSGEGDIRIASTTVDSRYAGALPEDSAEFGDLQGVAGAGIWGSTSRGNVEVVSGKVTTRGEGAYGIGAQTGWGVTDASGVVSVTSTEVDTAGNRAYGIFASTTGTGTVTVDSGRIRTAGAQSIGLYAESLDGSAVISSDEVVTTGDRSHGIWAVANGENVQLQSVSVSTAGYRAFGVAAQGAADMRVRAGQVVTLGELSLGVLAIGESTEVEAGSVRTAGIEAHGILTEASDRARVVATTVDTTGAGAVGILAISNADAVEVQAGQVTTAGEGAVGIDASAVGDISVAAAGVETTGAGAHGIRAQSSAGDIDIATGAVDATGAAAVAVAAVADAGDITIRATGDVRSAQSWAIDASAAAGSVLLDVGAGNAVEGGVRLHSLLGSTININGEIIGTGGDALVVSGGAATVNNYSNTIIGSIRLTDGNDVFNNVGTWVASGSSDFGAGNDRLVNTGLFAATAVGTTTLANLGTFVNEGTMDLANGRSGDRLEMPGTTFVGGSDSVVRVDVDFATGSSDTLALGKVEGTTRLQVNDASSGPGFDLEGISIIESDQPLTGSEFSMDLGLAGGGLVAYDLEFDPATGRFVVKALPGSASFELIKAAAAGQDFWAKSGDAWAARMLAARDGAATGMGSGNGVWLEGHAGGLDFENRGRFDLGGGTVERDMSTDSSWNGVQAGYDRIWGEDGQQSMFGVTAGHTNYELSFAGDGGGRYDLDGANLGVYGSHVSGRFFVHGLAKLDHFKGELRTSQAELGGHIEGASYGARIDAGLRFGERLWLEPVVGASWVRTRVDDFESALVEAEFDTATSLQTRVGVRFGGSGEVSGATLVPSLGVYAVDERKGDNRTVLWLRDEGHAAVDTPHDNYGRAEASLTLMAGNAQLFLRAGTDFGGGSDGFNGRVGLRWSW